MSEFLADNRGGLADVDGDRGDWIEIHNPTGAPVDLAGWVLADRPDPGRGWTFPSVTLGAGEYLVVFASGKNRNDPAGELHTDFKLNADGEHVILRQPGGAVASEFAFPAQLEDVAYGLSGNVVDEVVVPEGAPVRWLVPAAAVPGWAGSSFDHSSWASGVTGVGYDTSDDFDSLIGTDVQTQMLNQRGSIYLRVPFNFAAAGEVVRMKLNMRYDDGFTAWLNGQQFAQARSPATPAWNSLATEGHLDADALRPEEFGGEGAIGALVSGLNVLAIQGLNVAQNSSDLLFLPELTISRIDPLAPASTGFLPAPSPGEHNVNAVQGFVSEVEFSAPPGFYPVAATVGLGSATEQVSIRYTTDGTIPTETHGTPYVAPVTFSSTTVLRAVAYRDGYATSPVATRTYLFASDVRGQPDMDPDVINDPAYSGTVVADLSATLPVVSLVVDEAGFFGPGGIYSNPEASGRGAEVPVSVEFFDPAQPSGGFQIDAGVRIHGGNARSHPKKPLRLYFRGEYGSRRLEFPLFEGSPVDSFDQLILRSGGHDSWSLADVFGRDPNIDLPAHGTLMRDQFLRRTEVDMGMLSPRGRYVHLYINARYWGVYDLHERANAAFFESHLGGGESDYDVLHHPTFIGEEYTVVDGGAAAWEAARAAVAGGVGSAVQYQDIQEYLDLDNFIDHLISRMWSGDYDWCGPVARAGADVTVFRNKNWYAGRRSRGQPGTFRFFSWDAEMSMGQHLMFNLDPLNPPPQRVADFDLTGASDAGSPLEFYDALRGYPDFQRRFGDRLHKHLFNDGALATAASRARWDRMWSELRAPMVAESARWGDEGVPGPGDVPLFTRDGHWLPEVFWVRDSFIPARNATLIGQFRARGLYPGVDAPSFNQHGGEVAEGFALEMAAGGEAVYYTTDGSDPYRPAVVERFTFVDEFVPAVALAPTVANGGATIGNTWRFSPAPANIGAWTAGSTGVGYETTGTNYAPLINLDVGVTGGAYVRVPFTIAPGVDPVSVDELTLAMRYDDGFVAYLNGVEVASGNAPVGPVWNSLSTGNRPDNVAEAYQLFNIFGFRGLLREGENLLAIHVLNASDTSSDLLCLPRLTASRTISAAGSSPTATLYTGAVSLDRSMLVRARARASADGEWSALTEARFLVGDLASADNIVVSEFSYRPRPPASSAELAAGDGRTDFEFIELTNIGSGAIDLSGVSFSQGVDFSFALGGAHSVLPPGGQVLVVEDRGAFEARYGAVATACVAGEFASGSELSNDGENITLLAADGGVIKSFRYSDAPPWPTAADGAGFSLVLVDPASNPDHTVAANWTVSSAIDGTPAGQSSLPGYGLWRWQNFDPTAPDFDVVSAPGADPDGDGWVNAIEYALGTDPTVAGDRPELEVFVASDGGEDYLAVRYLARDLSDVQIDGEVSSDFGTWVAGTTPLGAPVPVDGGRLRHSLRATQPLSSAGGAGGIRLKVSLTP